VSGEFEAEAGRRTWWNNRPTVERSPRVTSLPCLAAPISRRGGSGRHLTQEWADWPLSDRKVSLATVTKQNKRC